MSHLAPFRSGDSFESRRHERSVADTGDDMETAVMTGSQENTAVKSDQRAGKYLTFQLGREEFGIRVLKVREIMGVQDITAVPQTPAHVKGVINLRGKVIPVVD